MLARAAVLGGFTIGLLQVWIIASVLRFLILSPWIQNLSWTGILLTPLTLFAAETVILLGLLLFESRTLGGYYPAVNEWKPSMRDGRKGATVAVALTTTCFVAAWWFICPPEYGRFMGSFVDATVSQTATELFSPPENAIITTTNVAEIARIENAKAIPHAAVISVVWLGFLFVLCLAFRYIHFAVNDVYLYDFPVETTQPMQGVHKFRPRGGSPN